MTIERQRRIGIIGGGHLDPAAYEAARSVGRLVACAGAMVVCGGLGGAMEAGARGCREGGGEVLGILPGVDAASANDWVTIPVVTGLGHARNILIAQTAEVLIAVEGEYGTLSEIAVALKLGRPVVALGRWQGIPGVIPAATPEEAVALALERLRVGR